MKRTAAFWLQSFVFAACWATASPALSTPALIKTLPAANCTPVRGDQWADFETGDQGELVSLAYYAPTEASSRFVICPYPRESTASLRGVVEATVDIRIDHEAAETGLPATFRCFLDNVSTSGSLTHWTTAAYSEVNSSTTLRMSLPASNANGHYTLYCSMPFHSRLYQYSIRER